MRIGYALPVQAGCGQTGPMVGLRSLVQNRQSRVMSLVMEQFTHHGKRNTN
jgi:hypothetical protein